MLGEIPDSILTVEDGFGALIQIGVKCCLARATSHRWPKRLGEEENVHK